MAAVDMSTERRLNVALPLLRAINAWRRKGGDPAYLRSLENILYQDDREHGYDHRLSLHYNDAVPAYRQRTGRNLSVSRREK